VAETGYYHAKRVHTHPGEVIVECFVESHVGWVPCPEDPLMVMTPDEARTAARSLACGCADPNCGADEFRDQLLAAASEAEA
jgi:hypothetical protein